MIEKNLDLIFEFEKYVLEHPKLVKKIPRNAVVSMRIEGDEKFNRWSQRLAVKQRAGRRPLFCVTIKKLRPARSRIEALEVERAA
jgi:hypothetical protein